MGTLVPIQFFIAFSFALMDQCKIEFNFYRNKSKEFHFHEFPESSALMEIMYMIGRIFMLNYLVFCWVAQGFSFVSFVQVLQTSRFTS